MLLAARHKTLPPARGLTPAQDGLLKLSELLPGSVVHERRAVSAQWLHTIYWPNNAGGYLNYHADPVFSAACLGWG